MKILKIASILLLLIIIFSIAFLRIIPNYSNKFGFEIVTLNNYKKYQDGYCLKENRILPKDELYKRAVIDYLKNDLIITKTAEQTYCKKLPWVTSNFCKDSTINKIGYYSISNYDNDMFIFAKSYKNHNYFKFYNKEYFLLNFFNAKPYQILEDDILIDLKSKTAGFKPPQTILHWRFFIYVIY